MNGAPIPWGSTRLDRRPGSVVEVATVSLGLYSTPPVSHLELGARLSGYRPGMLEAALAAREVVGLRTLRGSAFLIPTDLLEVTVPATRERNLRSFAEYVERLLITADYATWSSRIDNLMSDRVARTVSAIKAELDPPEADRKALNFVINQMAIECRMVGTGVQKGWRSAENALARWEDWLPGVRVDGDPVAARVRLAELYLSAWGPASAGDLAWWSGLTLTQARTAMVGCGAEPWDPPTGEGGMNPESTGSARRFPHQEGVMFLPPQGGVPGRGAGGLFFLPGLDIDVNPPSGARLLPWWDTLFVTWKDRSRFIPKELLPFVYDRDGNAASVVLLGGRVAGVWSLGDNDTDLEIRAAPFGRFTAAQWKAIETEVEIVAGLAGSERVRVVRCDAAPNLAEGKRNLFLRPLRGLSQTP